MDIRELLDLLALARAEDVAKAAEAIQANAFRLDIQAGVDRYIFAGGWGHLLGVPTRPGESSTATTGVPTNGIPGFGKGALFINFKGTAGTLLYVNTGTLASATWTNII